jgi:L-malate glycosyltransferase
MPLVDKKKVVITIPILLTGGTEIQTLNLVKVLSAEGYTVVVICYYEYEDEMVACMEKAGAEVLLLKLLRKDGLLSLCRKLVRHFKIFSPDIVHVQYVAPGLVPIVAARLAGVKKVVATVHQPARTYGWKAKFLLRFGAKLCNAFFCVSKSAEESWFGDSALFDAQLFKNGRRHFTVYNAVDVEKIARASLPENVAALRSDLNIEGKKVIGYVGRLRSEKGPQILIEAFSKLVPKYEHVVLLVVGDGPDRQALEEQATRCGVNKKILWLGNKLQNEVFQLYGLMDVIAIPSFFEGFGLTAAEARAAGVPVVASKIDGLKEVLQNGVCGSLVSVGDSDALALKIATILHDSVKAEELSAKGRERVKRNFSTTIYTETIHNFYSLLDN